MCSSFWKYVSFNNPWNTHSPITTGPACSPPTPQHWTQGPAIDGVVAGRPSVRAPQGRWTGAWPTGHCKPLYPERADIPQTEVRNWSLFHIRSNCQDAFPTRLPFQVVGSGQVQSNRSVGFQSSQLRSLKAVTQICIRSGLICIWGGGLRKHSVSCR